MSRDIDDPINGIGLSSLITDAPSEDISIEALEQSIVLGKAIDYEKKREVDPVKSIRQHFSNYEALSIPGERSTPERETKHSDDLAFIDNFQKSFGETSSSSFGSTNTPSFTLNAPPPSMPSADDSDSESEEEISEKSKQEQINRAFETSFNRDGSNTAVISETEDIEFTLEKIAELRKLLQEDDINLDNVPIVDKRSSPEAIRNAYKILQIKNERSGFASIGEEVIMSGANWLEDFFNGEREILGRRPDLTGWSGSVRQKLKRMRHETSTFVGQIMKKYGLCSGGWRLFIELIPSMFLHTRHRRLAKNNQLVLSKADLSLQEGLATMQNQFK
jgi:hypothetical protein